MPPCQYFSGVLERHAHGQRAILLLCIARQSATLRRGARDFREFTHPRRPALLAAMLIHNAHFWLKEDLSAEDRTLFENEVKRLAQIPYLERGFAGKPAPTEERPVTDHTFDYATSLHFKTMEDHEFYQKECPDHARFVAKCRPFFKRVIVFDVAPMS